MEQIVELWPTLSGALIVPLIGKLKQKWPNSDVPILWWLLQIALSVGLAFGLNWLFDAAASPNELIRLALGTAVVATGFHAGFKTKEKLKDGAGK